METGHQRACVAITELNSCFILLDLWKVTVGLLEELFRVDVLLFSEGFLLVITQLQSSSFS